MTAEPVRATMNTTKGTDGTSVTISFHGGALVPGLPKTVTQELDEAVTVAALTIYDMCKAADKGMTITDIYLESKTGGKSGTYRRKKV